MTGAQVWTLLLAAALVPVTAWFAAAQTAYGRMTVARALRLREEGGRGGERVVSLMRDAARTLGTIALVLLTAQVTAVALLVVALRWWFITPLAVLLGAGAGSLGLFVVAELAPRTLAAQHPDAVARRTSASVAAATRLLGPLVSLLVRLGNVIAPGRGLAQGPFVDEEALRDLIDVAEHDELIERREREMIHSIFELGDTLVREIMVPGPDVVMVSEAEPLAAVLDVVLARGHSRLPVHAAEDRDAIVGLVYAKDVLRHLHAGAGQEGDWSSLRRPAHFVPELKPVDALLRELQAQKVHLAVVVDEYGAIAGIVTIEDIVEEIVGEIVDEYDTEAALVTPLGDGRWRVDARLPVDELDELVGGALPDEDWDSVGGLFFGVLGHVPRPGERVEVDGLVLTAERIEGRRIATVLVERAAPVATEAPAEA